MVKGSIVQFLLLITVLGCKEGLHFIQPQSVLWLVLILLLRIGKQTTDKSSTYYMLNRGNKENDEL
jgi:hypothetical protein